VDLAILVPMLGRAHRVAPLLDSIRATCDARTLFLVTPGDDEVCKAVADAGGEQLEVQWQDRGDYARKINAGIAATTEPLIFTGACDLHFHRGWLEAATARLRPGVGVVGTNDMTNRRTMNGQHATHMLVTRVYVERFGTIDEPGKFFHEGYPHEWVDDEAVGTARYRGAWAHATDSRVEHLHPMGGKAPLDDLYAAQTQRITAGRPLFLERRRLWT
jgi:hypothetical protein